MGAAALDKEPLDRSHSHFQKLGPRQKGRTGRRPLSSPFLLVTKPTLEPEARESSDVVHRGQPLRTSIRTEKGEEWVGGWQGISRSTVSPLLTTLDSDTSHSGYCCCSHHHCGLEECGSSRHCCHHSGWTPLSFCFSPALAPSPRPENGGDDSEMAALRHDMPAPCLQRTVGSLTFCIFLATIFGV